MLPRLHWLEALKYLARVGLFVFTYIGIAQIGLLFASTPGDITPVWPLSGVVLAALLCFGLRLWPAVLLGDLFVGLRLGIPPIVASGIAIGTTLEAVLGVVLLRRFVGFQPALDRLRDVLGLIIVAGGLSIPVGATIATTSLWLGGIETWGSVATTWLTWWIGDLMGVMVVTPLLLTWSERVHRPRGGVLILEEIAFYAAFAVVTGIVFNGRLNYTYTLFPFIIYAALRLGPRGSATAIASMSIVTIWFTASGTGPFARETVGISLIFLQIFLSAATITALLLSALIAERRRTAAMQRLVADAGTLFAQSLDYETTLQNVARLITQTLADICVIDLITADGKTQRVAVVCADPAKEAHVSELYHYTTKLGAANQDDVATAPGASQAILLSVPAACQPEADSPDAAYLCALRKLGICAGIAVPLSARGRLVGGMLLYAAESGRQYQPEDVILAENLARHAAQAIENARLYAAAQDAIQQKDETLALLDTLLAKIPVGFGFLDHSLRYRRVNAAFANLNGLPQVTLPGHMIYEITPDLAAILDPFLRGVFATGIPLMNLEIIIERDGSSQPPAFCLAGLYPVTIHDELLGVGIIIIDITERRELEAQLVQAQKMESIGRLAGGIAHDFNNLLTVIRGRTDMAQEVIPATEPVYQDLVAISDAADRAAKLTRQLLAFARRQPLDLYLTSLNDLVRDICQLLRRLISEDIEIETYLEPDLGQTMIDPVQIEQVLVNLCINGRDAMPGGGTLKITTANVTLNEATARHYFDLSPGPYVTLAVSDTGIGMDAHIKSHVFEPFFTTKEKGKGTGLGLAICYGIVKQSNGHIEVESEVGTGTTFTIYLPSALMVSVTPTQQTNTVNE